MASTRDRYAVVSFAGTDTDRRDALAVRSLAYRARLGLDPSRWQDDRYRDAEGLLPVLRVDDVTVASARVLAVASPYCELRTLGHLPMWAERDPYICEVNRVAAINKAAHGLHSARLFVLGIMWLLGHTVYRRYVASIRHSLLPFYEALGARAVSATFEIAERGNADYIAIYGSFARTMQCAARYMGDATLEVESTSVSAVFGL
jgi:hypothetical protein